MSRTVLLCLLTFACLATTGCVRRRLTVLTDTPGATIYVNDQEVGNSPVSLPFTYYGPRKIQAIQDRRQTVTVMENIRAPWYQWTPFDFISENLIPWEIRDEREVRIEMPPQPVETFEGLWQRAEEIRHASGGAPLPARAGFQPR